MFKNKIIINLEKHDDIFHLRPIGDVHVGSPNFNKNKFESTIEQIKKDPLMWTIGMGDYIDNILAYANGGIDKRWNYHAQRRSQMTTLEQVSYFVKWWSKVANKSLGMHTGNHEWKTVDKQRFIMDFCNPVESKIIIDHDTDTQTLEPMINPDTKKANVLYNEKYLGRMAFTHLGFNYNKKRIANYTIVSHHGGYSGMKKGGAVNRMTDIVNDFDCDLLLMGHNHDAGVSRKTRLRLDYSDFTVYRKKILLGNTGTFMDSYKLGHDGYEEISPREAKDASTITITFEPYKGGIKGHE